MQTNTTKLELFSSYINRNVVKHTEKVLVKPNFVSLFSGAGGSSLGYHNAGFKELLAIDYEKHAVDCFKLNFPKVPVRQWDLDKYTATDILNEINLKVGELDTLDASSSCVNLSRANTKAKLYATSNLLLLKLAQFVAEIQPKTFLFENVEGLLLPKNRALFLEFQRRLNMLNYVWEYKVARAEEYGVPQARRRVIFIGIRKDVYKNRLDNKFFPQPNLSEVVNLALNKVLKNVTGYSPGQFKDTFCYGNRPVCTLTATPSLWFYDENGNRRKPFIPELKKIHTFPDDFILLGSFNQQWKRIGNAVPPLLIKAFAEHLNKYFLQPYFDSPITTEADNNEIKRIANHFKRFGFRISKPNVKFSSWNFYPGYNQ